MAVQRRTLSRGTMYSHAVRDLQTQLRDAGYDVGPVDGDFGIKTRRAVSAFQKDHGITVDGVVGPETWGALSKFFDNQDHLDASVANGSAIPRSKPGDMGEVSDADLMGDTEPANLQGATALAPSPGVASQDNPMGTALPERIVGGGERISIPNGGDLSAYVKPAPPPGQEPGQPVTPLTRGMGPASESSDSPETQQALAALANQRGRQFIANSALANALLPPNPQLGVNRAFGYSPFDALSGNVPPQGQMVIPEGNPMLYPWMR